MQQQVVKIEVRYDLILSFELNVAHRAFARGAAGGEDGVYQCAERTHSVAAGMASLPDDEDLNRAQLPDVDAQIEVPKEFTDRGLKIGLELLVLHSGHADC